jgi:hypothetical protein
MTRLTPSLSSLKTLSVTAQTPQEAVLGTPETLPTSEPATPQIGYTVASADLPVINISVYSKKWTAVIIGAGKFVTAGTCYWRMKKNGASVNTGSFSVAANTYYTIHACFYDINVGDVLELAIWSSVTDGYWDYKAYQCQVTRIIPTKERTLHNLVIGAGNAQPVLTQGSLWGTDGSPVYHVNWQLSGIEINGGLYNIPVLYVHSTYGLYRTKFCDASWMNTVLSATNATYRPYYRRSALPSTIKFRLPKG